ncbi:MAG: peptidoglycan-binding protein [Rickettsiales bacterium]|nr:peptidoglycan-binding protein [Rickettsiales bacterium]
MTRLTLEELNQRDPNFRLQQFAMSDRAQQRVILTPEQQLQGIRNALRDGADPNLQITLRFSDGTTQSHTALHFALSSPTTVGQGQRTKIAEAFIQSGANPDLQSRDPIRLTTNAGDVRTHTARQYVTEELNNPIIRNPEVRADLNNAMNRLGGPASRLSASWGMDSPESPTRPDPAPRAASPRREAALAEQPRAERDPQARPPAPPPRVPAPAREALPEVGRGERPTISNLPAFTPLPPSPQRPEVSPPPPDRHGAAPEPRNLARGSQGDDVKALQQRLIREGFLPEGGDDGRFGPRTQAAVANLQRERGLNVDGIVGPETNGSLQRSEALQQGVTRQTTDKLPAEPAPLLPDEDRQPTTSAPSHLNLSSSVLSEIDQIRSALTGRAGFAVAAMEQGQSVNASAIGGQGRSNVIALG